MSAIITHIHTLLVYLYPHIRNFVVERDLNKIKVMLAVQSPNQKIPDRKTKCVIKTHINIKQNVIFGAKLKPV